jgi:hypothetical protein
MQGMEQTPPSQKRLAQSVGSAQELPTSVAPGVPRMQMPVPQDPVTDPSQ